MGGKKIRKRFSLDPAKGRKVRVLFTQKHSGGIKFTEAHAG